jgi:hypothetical protein
MTVEVLDTRLLSGSMIGLLIVSMLKMRRRVLVSFGESFELARATSYIEV